MKNRKARKCRPIWSRLRPASAIFGALAGSPKNSLFVMAHMRGHPFSRLFMWQSLTGPSLFAAARKLMMSLTVTALTFYINGINQSLHKERLSD